MNTPQPSTDNEILWQPTQTVIENANLTHYMRWLDETRQLHFETYPELHRWSVEHLEDFWASLWDYFGLKFSGKWETPLVARVMPGAVWFPGVRLNYAENIFARMTTERPMLIYKAENQPLIEISWASIYDQTRRLAAILRDMGVNRGDRVVCYLPNIPETIVALLATASLGAIWSSCSPDFGSRSVLDRFTQIEPKVLIAVDGYPYNGKAFDRREVVAELQAALPTLQHTILVPQVAHNNEGLTNTVLWDKALATASPPTELAFEQVPFDHPLWVLYSSGTTGLPKPIVHGHGGVLLEQSKTTILHNDLKPGDRFFWFTSTGWMMWNYLVGSLLSGATAILYTGSPSFPSMNTIFELVEQSSMTYFGTSAAFISACMKAEIYPNQHYDLSKIRAL
ncbi:MAG TPA: AMP-binding protein, partial [Terriglobales bacterium]|nr:AMP-binding protein [Terriglobales bacterium]